LPSEVAVKCIRSNETMAKAALNEMKYLIQLRHAPGIVPLLLPRIISINANNNNPSSYPTTTPIRPPLPIEFKGHTLLIFPYEPYNLRDVLLKFGRGVGLSLTAVKSYFGQLLAAATHLQKHKILHADIKPDNILVSGDFSKVMICDFGSAMDASDGAEGIITPYLVSRFYRAPEIILGLPVSYSIDLWSLAVTAAELFLGKVLFHGTTNNDMLHMMMDTMGPFSTRMIRSHVLQTQKHPLPAHFLQQQSNYVFRQETIGALFSVQRRKWTLFIWHDSDSLLLFVFLLFVVFYFVITTDPVLGQALHKEVSLVNTFNPTLQSKLLKARSLKDSRSDVLKFSGTYWWKVGLVGWLVGWLTGIPAKFVCMNKKWLAFSHNSPCFFFLLLLSMLMLVELLSKCLVLDPAKRITVKAALQHDFFKNQQQQNRQ
jgi:serine/threonine protein kinase